MFNMWRLVAPNPHICLMQRQGAPEITLWYLTPNMVQKLPFNTFSRKYNWRTIHKNVMWRLVAPNPHICPMRRPGAPEMKYGILWYLTSNMVKKAPSGTITKIQLEYRAKLWHHTKYMSNISPCGSQAPWGARNLGEFMSEYCDYQSQLPFTIYQYSTVLLHTGGRRRDRSPRGITPRLHAGQCLPPVLLSRANLCNKSLCLPSSCFYDFHVAFPSWFHLISGSLDLFNINFMNLS